MRQTNKTNKQKTKKQKQNKKQNKTTTKKTLQFNWHAFLVEIGTWSVQLCYFSSLL